MNISTYARLLTKKRKNDVVIYFIFQVLSIIIFSSFSNFIVGDYYASKEHLDNIVIGFSRMDLCLLILLPIFFLNLHGFDFYLRSKSEEITIFKIGGASYSKIIHFIFKELRIILMLALVIGFPLGLVTSTMVMSIASTSIQILDLIVAIPLMTIILFLVIFILQMLYLFALIIRFLDINSLSELLRYKKAYTSNQKDIAYSKLNMTTIFNAVIGLISLYWLWYFLMYSTVGNAGDLILGSAFGSIVYIFSIRGVVCYGILWIRDMFMFNKTNAYLILTYLYQFFIKMKSTIMLFGLSVFFLITSTLLNFGNYTEVVILMIVCIVTALFLFFTFFFQTTNMVRNQITNFDQLYRLGKTKKDIHKIIFWEIFIFCTISSLLIYALPFISLYKYCLGNVISTAMVNLITLCYTAIALIMSVCIYQYSMYLLKKSKEEV